MELYIGGTAQGKKAYVTRQAVARWETGKALPGTANLFMLRQLLGIPLEAADMEATDLEGTTGTEKSGTLANTEKAESLTAKQKWMLLKLRTRYKRNWAICQLRLMDGKSN